MPWASGAKKSAQSCIDFLEKNLGEIVKLMETINMKLKNFLVFGGIPLLCAAPFISGYLLNNWRLNRAMGSIQSLQHPSSTKYVRTISDVGNLGGTGNQCDYFAAEIREFKGSKTPIESFYRGLKIKNPINGQPYKVNVTFFEGSELPHDSELKRYDDINSWGLSVAANKTYVVYFIDGGYSSGWDVRCY